MANEDSQASRMSFAPPHLPINGLLLMTDSVSTSLSPYLVTEVLCEGS